MNTDTNVQVLLTMRDQATPQLKAANQQLVQYRTTMGEMVTGATYLGTAFLSMGIALKESNNELAKSIGSLATMIGGIFAFIGSASHFVYAVAYMTSALQKFNIAQIVANALSGPAGWLKLAVGGLVAGGAAFGLGYLARGGGGGGRQATNVTVHQHIQGSVLNQKELGEDVRGSIIKIEQRNGE